MRSFQRVNYALRLNKSVERRLIFRCLARLRDRFPLKQYRYLGMGAMWFVDFLMAHRQLEIVRMISFERFPVDARRARSNAPLKTIEVWRGDAADNLSRIRLDVERCVCWLDFDDMVSDSMVATIRRTAARMRSGNILIVTVAAKKPPSSNPKPHEQWFREIFQNAIPAELPLKYFNHEDLSAFPTHLAYAIIETLKNAVLGGAGKRRFRPLFAFVYGDGQKMSTVGGIVVNRADESRLDKSDALKLPFVGESVTRLDVPHLTAREKAALDRLLPARRIGTRRAHSVDIFLSPEALAAYARWYRDYPLFAEVELR